MRLSVHFCCFSVKKGRSEQLSMPVDHALFCTSTNHGGPSEQGKDVKWRRFRFGTWIDGDGRRGRESGGWDRARMG
jgi:hypothetical protein